MSVGRQIVTSDEYLRVFTRIGWGVVDNLRELVCGVPYPNNKMYIFLFMIIF